MVCMTSQLPNLVIVCRQHFRFNDVHSSSRRGNNYAFTQYDIFTTHTNKKQLPKLCISDGSIRTRISYIVIMIKFNTCSDDVFAPSEQQSNMRRLGNEYALWNWAFQGSLFTLLFVNAKNRFLLFMQCVLNSIPIFSSAFVKRGHYRYKRRDFARTSVFMIKTHYFRIEGIFQCH